MKKGVHAPTYRSWQMMKNRCLNPRAMDYSYYGGRGVMVPLKWHTYGGFLEDMGERPVSLTLERRDGNKDYSAGNCCWATRREQSRNRDYTLDLEYAGRTQKVWEWAKELGIKQVTVHHRLWQFKAGVMNIHEVFMPKGQRPKKKIATLTWGGVTMAYAQWADALDISVDGLCVRLHKFRTGKINEAAVFVPRMIPRRT